MHDQVYALILETFLRDVYAGMRDNEDHYFLDAIPAGKHAFERGSPALLSFVKAYIDAHEETSIILHQNNALNDTLVGLGDWYLNERGVVPFEEMVKYRIDVSGQCDLNTVILLPHQTYQYGERVRLFAEPYTTTDAPILQLEDLMMGNVPGFASREEALKWFKESRDDGTRILNGVEYAPRYNLRELSLGRVTGKGFAFVEMLVIPEMPDAIRIQVY